MNNELVVSRELNHALSHSQIGYVNSTVCVIHVATPRSKSEDEMKSPS